MYESDLIPDGLYEKDLDSQFSDDGLQTDIIPKEKKPLDTGVGGGEQYDDEDYEDDDYEEARRPAGKVRGMSENIMDLYVQKGETKSYIADRELGLYLRSNYPKEYADRLLDAISGAVLIFTRGSIDFGRLGSSLRDMLKKYAPGDRKLEMMVEGSIYDMGLDQSGLILPRGR